MYPLIFRRWNICCRPFHSLQGNTVKDHRVFIMNENLSYRTCNPGNSFQFFVWHDNLSFARNILWLVEQGYHPVSSSTLERKFHVKILLTAGELNNFVFLFFFRGELWMVCTGGTLGFLYIDREVKNLLFPL